MIIRATQKNTRQTPLKVRLVANQVRKLPLDEAMRQLAVMEKKSTIVLIKTLNQAIANAKHNYGLELADLELANILVNDGQVYKRFRAVSRGRAHHILKKTCHIIVELAAKKTQAAGDKKLKPVKQQSAPAAKLSQEAQAKTKLSASSGPAPKPLKVEPVASQVINKSAGQTAAHRRSGSK